MDLDIEGAVAVVVGLGAVGRRKVMGLIEAGALVRGVDPVGLDPGVDRVIDLRREAYRPAHLDAAKLVIAASTPEVNRAVVLDARARGIWVSSASEPRQGDFTIPAVWRSGALILTVSTGGASPALAATLRDRAAEAIGPEASALATLLIELRAEVLARVADPAARRLALQQAADPAWLDHLARSGADATKDALRAAMGLA